MKYLGRASLYQMCLYSRHNAEFFHHIDFFHDPSFFFPIHLLSKIEFLTTLDVIYMSKNQITRVQKLLDELGVRALGLVAKQKRSYNQYNSQMKNLLFFTDFLNPSSF